MGGGASVARDVPALLEGAEMQPPACRTVAQAGGAPPPGSDKASNALVHDLDESDASGNPRAKVRRRIDVGKVGQDAGSPKSASGMGSKSSSVPLADRRLFHDPNSQKAPSSKIEEVSRSGASRC